MRRCCSFNGGAGYLGCLKNLQVASIYLNPFRRNLQVSARVTYTTVSLLQSITVRSGDMTQSAPVLIIYCDPRFSLRTASSVPF